MGDFGFSIHYGLYKTPYDSVAKASENTLGFMVGLIRQRVCLGSELRLVDLGPGCGGAAHYLALNYGVQITCVNICPEQNKRNFLGAQELGIDHLITIVECSFEQLTQNWANSFDVVWSEEAICHAEDKHQVIREIKRVLSAGGICVFTDLMGSKKVSMEEIKTFSDRNAVTGLACVSDYIDWSFSEELKNVTHHDFTSHLGMNFQKMIDQIDHFWHQMKPSSICVNIARAGVCNQDDLYHALRAKEIGLALLDVTEPEPLPISHPLNNLENCIIFPHIATNVHDSRVEIYNLALNEIYSTLEQSR